MKKTSILLVAFASFLFAETEGAIYQSLKNKIDADLAKIEKSIVDKPSKIIKNPFQYKVVEKGKIKKERIRVSVTLDAILYDRKNPKAVINGKVYKKGQRVKGMRIVRISKNGIWLKRGRKTIRLTPKKNRYSYYVVR